MFISVTFGAGDVNYSEHLLTKFSCSSSASGKIIHLWRRKTKILPYNLILVSVKIDFRMTANEFIAFWKNRKDTDNTPAVGIGVSWDKISPQDCSVQQYQGKVAWEKIGDFWAPYWGNFKRTILKEWLDQSRQDYQKFIGEETSIGKIGLYEKSGLLYPDFCAFADETGTIGSLGDGCHRYIDCNFLVLSGKDLTETINKCRLDVLCVPNLEEVLSSNDVPPTYKK